MDNLYEHSKPACKRIIHHARLTDVIKQIPLTTDRGKNRIRQLSIPMIKGHKVLLNRVYLQICKTGDRCPKWFLDKHTV